MSRTNLASSLLSLLAVQGFDEGDAFAAAPGARTVPTREGEPLVTLILAGVAARLAPRTPLSQGLAGPGDLIHFDAAAGSTEAESALWLTEGRFLAVPAHRLTERIDRATLMEMAIADLRRRNHALQAELARHSCLRVSRRLSALLLEVHDLSGDDTVVLRQSDLAELLAVRRASISTACAELLEQGAVQLRRGAIRIADLDALRRIAGDVTPP